MDKVDESKLVLEAKRVNAPAFPARLTATLVRRRYDEDDDDASALAAIQLLVRDVPRERRREAARRIYELLREEYGNAGPPAPEWLMALRRRVDAELH